MAKGKRKSRRIKVSQERVRQAQWAKSHGLISKKAKLNGGRLSPALNKKMETLTYARAVPTYTFRPGMKSAVIDEKPRRVAEKASKAQVADAKKRGILTVGNNIIIPNKPEYKQAVKEGKTAGFRPQSPATGGGVDVIILQDEGIENYADLRRALKSGRIDRKYLKGNKLYSFTFFDHHPKLSRTFLDGKELADYLERYQWTEEAFEAFELITLPDGTTLGPTPEWVKRLDRMKFAADGRRPKKRKSNPRDDAFKEMKRRVSKADQDAKHKEAQRRYVLKQKKAGGALYVKEQSAKRSARRHRWNFDQ